MGGAIGRREEWATREIAMEGFLKKPFFRAWDERVLGRYIELGLRDKVGGGVVLKTRGRDEAVSPFFPSPFILTFKKDLG